MSSRGKYSEDAEKLGEHLKLGSNAGLTEGSDRT